MQIISNKQNFSVSTAMQSKTFRRKRQPQILGWLAMAIIFCFAGAGKAFAVPGELDPTFGAGGKIITDLPGDNLARQVEVQPDGKIVALVHQSGVNAPRHLLRYNPDGTLDASFGASGVLIGSFGDGFVILPDGKLLVVGKTNSYRLAVYRFNSNGAPDATWGAGGVVTANEGFNGEEIIVQPDGKIVVFSNNLLSDCGLPGCGGLFTYVRRFNANGTLDATFGTNGLYSFDYKGSVVEVRLQRDGKILFLQGDSIFRFRIGRVNANGTLDTTFNAYCYEYGGCQPNGYLPIYTDRITGNTFDLQTDGKIVVAQTSVDSRGLTTSFIYRYDASGRFLDSSFGRFGSVTIAPQSDAYFELNSVIVQRNGRIIAGGTKVTGSSRSFALVRFNRNGEIDRVFGTNGFALATLRGVNDVLKAMAFPPDGKLVALGDVAVSLSEPYGIGLARFQISDTRSQPTQIDFDGDGKADISVFRTVGGLWRYLSSSTNVMLELPWGLPTDKLAPADYDGDGRTDFAVFRDGAWYIYRTPSAFITIQFGQESDVPVPADYDGDGRADAAVFRAGFWHIRQSSDNQIRVEQFGLPTDKPVLGDYDGDGRNDLAVYRDGTWYIQNSLAGFKAAQFGSVSDMPVAADYDGDGKTDFAVYRPREGTWYLQKTSQGFTAIQFGIPTDKPAPADYDGDGKADIAVFRNGTWYLLQSKSGFTGVTFGALSDIPIESSFLF